MNYYTWHVFRISTPFKEKLSDHFKGLRKLKLLTNSDVNLITSLVGIANTVLNF